MKVDMKFTMFRHYSLTSIRHIHRQKGFSLLNILGLILGFTFAILILLYVQFELSFDHYHTEADRIYRIASEFPASHTHGGKTSMTRTVAPLGPALVNEFPEVESAVRFFRSLNVLMVHNEESFLEKEVYFADPQVFDIFSLPLVLGNAQAAFEVPHSIVLSQRAAAKYFGSENPLGKIVRYRDELDLKVTGVFRNMPKNSHFIMDFIIPFETFASQAEIDLTRWRSNFCATYILVAEGTHPQDLENKFPGVFRKYASSEMWPGAHEYCRPFLQPLTKIHLYSDLDGEYAPNNDINNIYLFSTVALLILIIACINYMNLATARSSKRGKEVAIRKIVGAQRKHLLLQYYGEAFIYMIVALILSLILVDLMLPAFNAFIDKDLSFFYIFTPPVLVVLIIVTGLASFLAGSYPALLISSFRPIMLLKRQFFEQQKSHVLRNGLVVFQFFISIVLIISAIVVRDQLKFIKNRDVGYKRDQIVVIRLRDPNIGKNLDALKVKLKSNPDVIGATVSNYLPDDIRSQTSPMWPGKPENYENFDIYISYVDEDYLDVFGIELVQGRNFSREFSTDTKCAFIFNETLVKTLGWDNPLEKEFLRFSGETGRIVGVVKDFNFLSLHNFILPMYLYTSQNPQYSSFLSVKIRENNIQKTLAFLEKTWKDFSPHYPFDFSFFDDIFDMTYRTEHRLGSMFNVFSLLAAGIACLGLFGLAAYTAEKRTKEIGIRKALGASSPGIFWLLSKTFTRWVVISNLFSWPVAYWFMHSWLQNFAYRTTIGWELFLEAGVLSFGIALLTVGWQSFSASQKNPVDALRYE